MFVTAGGAITSLEKPLEQSVTLGVFVYLNHEIESYRHFLFLSSWFTQKLLVRSNIEGFDAFLWIYFNLFSPKRFILFNIVPKPLYNMSCG